MLWFRKKKLKAASRHTQEKKSNIEIAQAKKHTTRKINEVNDANERFMRLINTDSITLKIHIASGGGHKNVR